MAFQLFAAVLAVVAVQVVLAMWLRSTLGADRGLPRIPGKPGLPPFLANDPRSYQAVASEVAKRQVEVLSEIATELQQYDRACLAHARRVCELIAAEWRRAGFDSAPDQLPNDLEGAMRLIVRLRERALDEAAQARIRKDLEPNVTVLLAYAAQTTSRLEESRFWLGRALEQELRAYVEGMAAIFSELRAAPEALKASEGRYRALLKTHPEASRAIDRLSASGLAELGAT
jgi:hypothetical protein